MKPTGPPCRLPVGTRRLLIPLAVGIGTLAWVALAESAPFPPPEGEGASADTLLYEDYLDALQELDREFYSPDLLEIDPAVRDSALAVLDSLGLEGYEKLARSRIRPLEFDLGLASRMGLYNRVEGFIVGLGATLSFERRAGTELVAQGAYAFASQKVRYLGELRVPFGRSSPRVVAAVGYSDRVVRYGSNHPAANGLRALVGGSDDQDYLRSRGGWLRLTLNPESVLTLRLAYTAAEQSSIRGNTSFSIFGSMSEFNAPIDDGTDRSLLAGFTWGSLNRYRQVLTADYRVAGGRLGGDFTYTRSEFSGAVRRYLPANEELVLWTGLVVDNGTPTRQQLADVGGLSTVRGFSRRTRVGQTSFDARAEILVSQDLLALSRIPLLDRTRIQWVLWGDAARVWRGASDAWITSAGFGLQRYLGPFGEGSMLRLDVAFPMGPDRPDDVAVFLRFAEALFFD